ncbi:ferrochelatase [Dethiothermospora halolimnae]|uniref:ferrochelatase n=1 Tax=Dethiothermospora halolimnae TaxID=3114390 RepID=UPI003CCB91D8
MFKKLFINKNTIYIFMFIFFTSLFLSYRDPLENIFITIAFLGLILIIKNISFLNDKNNLIAFIICIIIFYIMSVLFIYNQHYPITKKSNLRNNNSDIAVLLVYDGESPKYNMSKSITNINLKDEIVNKAMLPFSLNKIKKQYKSIGKSNYKSNTKKIADEVNRILSNEYKIYLGYLYDTPYIEEEINQILTDGHNKIITVPIYLTKNKSYCLFRERINKMHLSKTNAQIRHTKDLVDSESIFNSFINKINSNINKEKLLNTGIVLIGSQEGSKESTEKDFAFRNKIKEYLIEYLKISEDRIAICWDNNSGSNYIKEVKKMLEYGVGEILCIYVKPSVTYIENNLIINNLLNEIELPDGAKIKVIDGFLEDNNFIYDIKRRVRSKNVIEWN